MPASISTPTASLPVIIAPRLRAPRGGLTLDPRDYRGGVYLPASARPVLEALASKAARVATVEPIEIGINGFAYQVRSVAIAASIGSVAYHLATLDKPGLGHHVHRSTTGEVVCDCGDFTFRKAGTGQACKHGRALAELGLIKSTTPRILPPFAVRLGSTAPAPAPTHDSVVMPIEPSPTWRTRFEPTSDDVQAAALAFGWS